MSGLCDCSITSFHQMMAATLAAHVDSRLSLSIELKRNVTIPAATFDSTRKIALALPLLMVT